MKATQVEKALSQLSREWIAWENGGALPRHIIREFAALIGEYGLNWSGNWGAVSCRYVRQAGR